MAGRQGNEPPASRPRLSPDAPVSSLAVALLTSLPREIPETQRLTNPHALGRAGRQIKALGGRVGTTASSGPPTGSAPSSRRVAGAPVLCPRWARGLHPGNTSGSFLVCSQLSR